ncbi:MAG: threonine--tRNA ligase [Candidatus Omnitrophota bacterium]|nr:MAG: threonine--tRNA ligase [Candidatus Omnitrophota bacterium]
MTKMEDKLATLRHSTAHVMASAVKQLFPDAKLGIGPAIENGFYYDFDLEHRFTPEDLKRVEEKMREIIGQDYEFKQELISKQEARRLFEHMGEIYKLEILDEIPDEKVSIYRHGDFVDLCAGPHLKSTSEIKAFKLLSIAGAYWRGDESRKMLQRIYGTAFFTSQELEEYLRHLQEAEKRDHRKLGKELGLFSFFESAGPGLVFYLPNGALLRKTIENYILEKHLEKGYQLVITPQIMKAEIWQKSGHLDYYRDYMYLFEVDNVGYAIKPMNCPGHILIFKSQRRSYKELPLRLFELGNVYRHEKTGVLHGLLRVRGFTQDDAHIFCTEGQLREEIRGVIEFTREIMVDFGFKDFEVELSTQPQDYIGTEDQWKKATQALRDALEDLDMAYEICEGEGAFYGPKIDIKLKDAIGRLWQCATIQCDFAGPERFDVTYVGEDGEFHRCIMIHRAILGSLERFLGTLIEHYGGDFPLWLAPEQVRLIPISEKFLAYGEKLKKILRQEKIRVGLDNRDETLNYKIRQAELEKVPYMVIFGKREEEKGTVSLRSRKMGDLGERSIRQLIVELKQEIGRKGKEGLE